MEKSRVVIVPCDNYGKETVYQAMKKGIDTLGGIGRFVKRDENILIKPNLLKAADPDKAITTHPSVIEAMFRILCEEGYRKVSYGDSPGHGDCAGAAKKLALDESAERYGIAQANMDEEVLVRFPEGMTADEFYFTKGVAEADAIINLCKLKTHALERMTGAVKNVYGFICGARKPAGHVKYPNAAVFARMLADIHRSRDIRLHITDAVVAMEGNGPGAGDPIPMNMLLFSGDPVALDAVCCRLIALDPRLVPTCVQGEAMGIGTWKAEKIEVIVAVPGEDTEEIFTAADQKKWISRFGRPDFRVERRKVMTSLFGFYSGLMTKFARRPHIDKDLCVKCGICVEHCPVPGKAVTFAKGKKQPPVYDYRKCIRCYCCQEMCPRKAIVVRKGIFGMRGKV